MPARLLLAVLVFVSTACSSGDDTPTATPGSPGTAAVSSTATSAPAVADTRQDETATSSTSASAATSTVATDAATSTPSTSEPDLTADDLADQDLARTALITLDDFPDGWVEDPSDDDDNEEGPDDFESEFDACLGRDGDDVIGDRLDRLAVGTGDFRPADSDATQVSHEVVLASDAATAADRMAEVDISGDESCVAAVIERFYRSLAAAEPDLAGVEIGQVVVTRTENDREPDLAVGVLIEIPLLVDDQSVSQYLEFLYQRQGRALSELSFSSFGQPFSRDGYTALSDEVVVGLATIGN